MRLWLIRTLTNLLEVALANGHVVHLVEAVLAHPALAKAALAQPCLVKAALAQPCLVKAALDQTGLDQH